MREEIASESSEEEDSPRNSQPTSEASEELMPGSLAVKVVVVVETYEISENSILGCQKHFVFS